MNKTIRLLSMLVVFLCLWVARPIAQAVNPPPDGGYPDGNTAEGQNALLNLTTGVYNTGIGFFSLKTATIGTLNTGIGAGTLAFDSGDGNTAVGAGALTLNDTGIENTATGVFALLYNQASFNAAFGAYALVYNISGAANNAFGWGALQYNMEGTGNNAVGFEALSINYGDYNTAIGHSAGATLSGNYNICIGAGVTGTFGSNSIRIGDNLPDDLGASACYIGGINGQTTPNGTAVYVSASGQLGTLTSSVRFKRDIKSMEKASEALLALKPVTFFYEKEIDPTGTQYFGLLAEDVEKINPDLVAKDKQGKPYSVRYDQVNAMLLNEFLKEHRKVEKLEATVADLAAQLQKITAQTQMKTSSVRVAGK